MLKHSLIVGLVVLISAGCSKKTEDVYFVEGVIIDSVDGSPVENAEVVLRQPGSGWFNAAQETNAVLTDEMGVFYIELPDRSDFLGGADVIQPSEVVVNHPDHCGPFTGSQSIQTGSSTTTQHVYEIDPKAYGRVIATSTGAFNGQFDEVFVSGIGSVPLQEGSVTESGVFVRCYQLDETTVNLWYWLNGEIIHQELFVFELARKDTLDLHINY